MDMSRIVIARPEISITEENDQFARPGPLALIRSLIHVDVSGIRQISTYLGLSEWKSFNV
jgi:hypothetical protein